MAKNTNEQHPRYQRFGVADLEAEGGLETVLFVDDIKLRRHAVKHFSNLTEFDDWQKLKRIPPSQIIPHIDELRKLGCPHLVTGTINPPCRTGEGPCKLFASCKEHAFVLEDLYLDLCRQVIQQGLEIPRGVHYTGTDGGEYHWFLANVPIVAKFEQMDFMYNLMTCFRPSAETRAPWAKVRADIVRSVRLQSRGIALWSTEETWGLRTDSMVKAKGRHVKRVSREEFCDRKNKKPYQREKDDWRGYLDRWES